MNTSGLSAAGSRSASSPTAAAAASSGVELCPHCHNVPDDPRVLHCLHTVCLSCLRTTHHGKHIKCPLCSFQTPCSSPDMLPRNTYAEASYRRHQGLRSCRNCGQRDAASYCAACASMLCTECDHAIHANAIFRKHSRLAIRRGKELAASSGEGSADPLPLEVRAAQQAGCLPVSVQCPRHATYALNAFCATCSTSICECCTQDVHRGHTVKPLSSAVKATIDAAPKGIQLLEAVERGLAVGADDVRDTRRMVQQVAGDCSAEINATMDRLMALIEARRQFLLARVADVAEKKLALLNSQLESLEGLLRSTRSSRELCAALTRYSSDFTLPDLVDIGAHIPAFCAFVTEQRLDVTPCVNHDIAVSFGPPAPLTDATVMDPPLSTAEQDMTTLLDAFGMVIARSIVERRFEFDHLGDHRGVLYYLGTSRGIKAYENPVLLKRVDVSSSSVGYGRLEHVVSDGAADFCTHNESYAWVCVEIEAPLCLTYYALHHDAYDKESRFLRSWELQGWRSERDAPGGHVWDALAVHHNDKTLTEHNPAGAWAVTGCRPDGYKRFRVIQTGANSHGNHYLMLSALELYGVLLG
jgi:hypothetical protein